MATDRLPDGMVLSEAQLRDVIERAVRTAPKREGITIAELREIAAELDIDARALDRALDEVIGLPIVGRPVRTWLKRQFTKLGRYVDRFLPQSGRFVALGVIGAVAGWLNAFLMVFSVNGHYPIGSVMLGVTVANLLSRSVDKKFARYLGEIFATWVMYGILWSTTYGGVTQNLVVWCVLWIALATLAGSFLVRDPWNRGDATPLLPHASTETPSVAPESPDARTRESSFVRFIWPALLRPSRA